MAVGDVYKLDLQHTYVGQKLMNSLAFTMKTAADPSPALCLALANDWKDFARNSQVPSLTYTTWGMQQLRGGTASWPMNLCRRDGGLRLEGAFTGTLTGSNAGDGMPPQAAIVTTLSTGFSGRRRRGRHYLGGFPETIQLEGTITPAVMTTYTTLWSGMLAEYGVGGTDPNFQLGVWSMREATGCEPSETPPFRLTMVEAPDPAAAFLPVTSVTPRNIVYSQRRRTIGVGR